MTDPIADLLTRIRNALHARHDKVAVPASRLKAAVVDILKNRGYVASYRVVKQSVQDLIEIDLRYVKSGEPAISVLRRVSKPGCRIYTKAKDIRPVLGGRGVAIFSTPKGVLPGEEARRLGVGGECICQVS